MTQPIILTNGLCHTYQLGPMQKAALVDITMEIESGSCVAIIGVTGSGKRFMHTFDDKFVVY